MSAHGRLRQTNQSAMKARVSLAVFEGWFSAAEEDRGSDQLGRKSITFSGVSEDLFEIRTVFKLSLPSQRASAHFEIGATKLEIKKPSALWCWSLPPSFSRPRGKEASDRFLSVALGFTIDVTSWVALPAATEASWLHQLSCRRPNWSARC